MSEEQKSYGLEQARQQLPRIVAEAHTGTWSLITKHGKPVAAVVPLDELARLQARQRVPGGLLALAGSGRGLWGEAPEATLQALRDEWDARHPG